MKPYTERLHLGEELFLPHLMPWESLSRPPASQSIWLYKISIASTDNKEVPVVIVGRP